MENYPNEPTVNQDYSGGITLGTFSFSRLVLLYFLVRSRHSHANETDCPTPSDLSKDT